MEMAFAFIVAMSPVNAAPVQVPVPRAEIVELFTQEIYQRRNQVQQFNEENKTFTVRVIPSPDVVQRANTFDTVHLITAARVVDCDYRELTPWRVSVDLDKDVRDRVSTTSFTIDANNAVLRLDGVPYNSQGMLPGFDPSLEILMWYSLNYPVKARQGVDGSVDFVSMRGAEREDYMRGVKSRHAIGPWVEPESSRYNNPSIQECRTKLWKPIATTGSTGIQSVPAQSANSCVGGQCFLPANTQPIQYQSVPFQSFQGGSCANGQCGTPSMGVGFFRRR